MAEFLTGAALFILAVTALGLFRVLRSELAVERMMSVQLLGTGAAAALLLLVTASNAPAMTDVALLLMLLAASSCAAFALGQSDEPNDAAAPKGDEP